ncbi:MAG: glutamate racemase [Eubacteriales bacterium]|nr:glutamate racemase [Eubacteriales bacterium]
MDNRAIGVFDSGLGGLTAVRQLHLAMPNENIIYFGDTGRVPYGSRSRRTVLNYARQDVAFLNQHHIKAIVIACGTVSSQVLGDIKAENTIPIVGVVEPTCYAAMRKTKNNRIGIIGTKGTVRSGAYEAKLHTLDPSVHTIARPCPLFVPLVEAGRFQPDDRVTQLVIEEYLAEIRDFDVDTLILGCTHYPLLREAIQAFMGDTVTLIDSGAEAAKYVRKFLDPAQPGKGSTEYYVSDDPDSFDEYAEMFLGEPAGVRAQLVEIASY